VASSREKERSPDEERSVLGEAMRDAKDRGQGRGDGRDVELDRD
jgi:hypothetical protein